MKLLEKHHNYSIGAHEPIVDKLIKANLHNYLLNILKTEVNKKATIGELAKTELNTLNNTNNPIMSIEFIGVVLSKLNLFQNLKESQRVSIIEQLKHKKVLKNQIISNDTIGIWIIINGVLELYINDKLIEEYHKGQILQSH